jgi:predicted Holliday junction resolvase-like endonuclease
MSLEYKIILALSILSLLQFFLWRRLAISLQKTRFQKRSLSSKYGKITEQFLPFLDAYPYNPENFRFLGTPIDGIQFEENEIIFLEFKAADSRLTHKQQNIKNLIQNKRITFEEIRLR